ncbi:MAG: hypothetical protein C0483_00960 [Pirellula sp.]|nr:hypothetical protein [Pirellula sp.]
MPDANEKQQLKSPGPLWVWMVAAVVCSQVGKRVFGDWSLPKQFNYGTRFVENLVANLMWGLPVLIALIVAMVWVNRRKAP